MSDPACSETNSALEPQRIEADIVCVGFGPATAGFLTALTKGLVNADGAPRYESRVMPGTPPQILCYERADDISFGVSGVVTRARSLRASFPGLDPGTIPMAAEISGEKMVYLMDPLGASRRSPLLCAADWALRAFGGGLARREHAFELPWTPRFLDKKGGLLLSMGQFMQWVGAQLQGLGTVQIWPGTPVSGPLIEGESVVGVRLLDQGVDPRGQPGGGFMPGMEIRAGLTVVGEGPLGPVGRQLDAHFGRPESYQARDWAIGMKFVVDLPESSKLEAGTVIHTFGFPEPEIFGFMYVHPGRVASLGIFVPSWFDSPVRTTYRYLQHWMLHPYLWKHLQGGRLRSWGAKTLRESGRRGEPHLVGNGYARIGEGSGSTNVLTGSGVDEAWATGTQLAEGVLELLASGKEFTRQNLEAAYVQRRRASWLDEEARAAEKARDGFQRGFVRGLVGMSLAGLTNGRFTLGHEPVPPYKRIPTIESYFRGKISPEEIQNIRKECAIKGVSLHDTLMQRCGWPSIPLDGKLLVSHQDALLLGGKVQAPPGYADHVAFLYPHLCAQCGTRICIEACSGQALTPGPDGVPLFDREKCVHCGACYWNCSRPIPENGEEMNVAFRAGAGGLHSAEN